MKKSVVLLLTLGLSNLQLNANTTEQSLGPWVQQPGIHAQQEPPGQTNHIAIAIPFVIGAAEGIEILWGAVVSSLAYALIEQTVRDNPYVDTSGLQRPFDPARIEAEHARWRDFALKHHIIKNANKKPPSKLSAEMVGCAGGCPQPPNDPRGPRKGFSRRDGRYYTREEVAKTGFPYGIYENVGYHGNKDNGWKSQAPRDGQAALNNSFATEDSAGRIGISCNEFVALSQTGPGFYHGHVRTWDQLTEKMRAPLRKHGLVTKSGKII